MRAPWLVALAVLVAGCAGTDAPATDAVEVAPAAAAAAKDGGVAAPTAAYAVADDDGNRTTVHPYTLSGRARAPETREFTGAFELHDCDVPSALPGVDGWQFHDVSDLFEPGDVAEVHVALRWTNTDQNWADLHLVVNLPNGGEFTDRTTAEDRGEVVLEYTGQLRWPEEAQGSVGVVCFYGMNVQPVEYAITVHVVYAANAVPALTPFLFEFPDAARHLYVKGLPTGDAPVTGHFRVFGPDDALVGEFALNRDEEAAAVALPGPGAYVVIVDHTENGWVSLGADAPPTTPGLVPLARVFGVVELLRQDVPGPAAATVPFTLPRVPLGLALWADAADGDAGLARKMTLDVDGPRGAVLHFEMEGFVAVDQPSLDLWLPLLGPGWSFEYDHHALALGDHVASVDAEVFRGELRFAWATYARPGEDAPPAPEMAPGGGALALPHP